MRLRVGIAVVAGVVTVGLLSIVGAGGVLSRNAQRSGPDPALSQKIAGLQEELRKKEMQLVVQESRLKELQDGASPVVRRSGSSEPVTPATVPPVSKPAPKDDGPLTAMPPATPAPQPPMAAASPVDEEEQESPPGTSVASGARQAEGAELGVAPEAASPEGRTASALPSINFNAQEVAAASESPNTGTVSFRLVKDQPEFRFSGYLFVIVEMEDPRGENKIYAYPEKTSLGEGYLPSNYKEGETLSFKYNQRVELSYGDLRPDASLIRLSVLLYGEDGKIVFQRGFDRKEIKVVRGSKNQLDRARTKAGEKRRAL